MSTHPTDTRAAIVEAALFCFSEHGFDGTSIRMIAKRAGRPLSLIGHHFGGKEGLYREVFRSLFNPLSTARFKAEEESSPEPRTRAEAVRQFREQVHHFYVEVCPGTDELNELREAGRRLWLMELRDPKPEILELLKDRLSPWVDRVRASIRVMRPDLSEAEVCFVGTTIMGQIAGHSLTRGLSEALWGKNQLNHFKSAELLIEFSLLGLGVTP